MTDIFYDLLGAVLIMFVFYSVIRIGLTSFIVIESHKILLSCLFSGVLGEVIYYWSTGIISLNYILASFVIYLFAIIRYNLKLRKASMTEEKQTKNSFFKRIIFIIAFVVSVIVVSLINNGEFQDMFTTFTTNNDTETVDTYDSFEKDYTEEVTDFNDTVESHIDISDATYDFLEIHGDDFAESLNEYLIKDISEMSLDDLDLDILVVLVKGFGIPEDQATLMSEELAEYLYMESSSDINTY